MHVEIGSDDLECHGAVVDDVYEKQDNFVKLKLGFSSIHKFFVAMRSVLS